VSATRGALGVAVLAAGLVAAAPVLGASSASLGPVAVALWAAALGLAVGPAVRAPRRTAALAPLLLGAATWFALDAAGASRPLPVALVVAALVAAGATVAARSPGAARAGLPLAAALLVLLGGLPDLFGAAPAGWALEDAERGARALDLSPASVLAEAAGVDWMRHPSVYAPAGTDWFSDARAPYDGTVVGWSAAIALLVLVLLAPSQPLRREPATRTETHRPEET